MSDLVGARVRVECGLDGISGRYVREGVVTGEAPGSEWGDLLVKFDDADRPLRVPVDACEVVTGA